MPPCSQLHLLNDLVCDVEGMAVGVGFAGVGIVKAASFEKAR